MTFNEPNPDKSSTTGPGPAFARWPAILVAILAVLGIGGFILLTVTEVPGTGRRAILAWGEVEQAYRQRADLVPAILTTVRGITDQHTELARQVETHRAAVLALAADPAAPVTPAKFRHFMAVQDGLSDTLGLVLDMMRLFPDKRRDPALGKVFDALELSESRIVVARTDYISNVRHYNNYLQRIPSAWIVGLFQPQARPMVVEFAASRS